jgi:hypothetical protein
MSFDVGPMSAKIQQYAAEMRAKAEVGLELAGHELVGRAAAIAPLEEGALSQSGRVERAGLMVGVGFGTGPSAAYATKQHEDLTLRHINGRQAKYLEQPLSEFGPDLIKIVGLAVKE